MKQAPLESRHELVREFGGKTWELVKCINILLMAATEFY